MSRRREDTASRTAEDAGAWAAYHHDPADDDLGLDGEEWMPVEWAAKEDAEADPCGCSSPTCPCGGAKVGHP